MTRARRQRQREGRRPVRRVEALLVAVSAVLVLTIVSVVPPRPAPVEASTEALPDLAMAPLKDFRIQWVNGRRMLRFTAMMVNIGDGHFELRGSRPTTSLPMVMRQVIFTDSTRQTIAREITTNAVASYAGDGHNHWHVDEMMRYDMWGTGGVFRGAKVGFCFLDSDAWFTSHPNHTGSYYTGSMCGTSPSALSNRMGISVGWGDEYEWYLAWQWIDITGVAGGTYTVRATVDPYDFFTETNEANQCAFARISFSESANSVTVHGTGNQCVNDVDSSPFRGDIAWAYAEGITVGCAYNLFCTSAPVTRAQMASFLARAMKLPAASRDYFTDDNNSPHQGDINRVAEAGITAGCTATRFCPDRIVTREQMASFLARAKSLPPASRDYFTDDATSPHQGDINRVAEAGITAGCTATRFCPVQPVTRGQMAAFLHRAFRN
jgi:hypothetical protein